VERCVSGGSYSRRRCDQVSFVVVLSVFSVEFDSCLCRYAGVFEKERMSVAEHMFELTRDDMKDLEMTLGDIKRMEA